MECRGAIRFATDLLMSPEQCVHIGWDAELVSCLLELIERLRDVHIDVVEFAILNAVVLLYPGSLCSQNVLLMVLMVDIPCVLFVHAFVCCQVALLVDAN